MNEYFPRKSFFNDPPITDFYEYIPCVEPLIFGTAVVHVKCSWVDNPIFIEDLSTEQYLKHFVRNKDCFCHNGKILMQPTAKLL